MGIGPFKKSSFCQCEEEIARAKAAVRAEQNTRYPNPDPSNFHVVKWKQDGDYLIVKVNYPDCTNYEGNKIMVYIGTYEELCGQRKLDPHFCDHCFSPIARFQPDHKGWKMAELFVKAMRANNAS